VNTAHVLCLVAMLCLAASPARAADEDARVLVLNALDPYLPAYLAIDAAMRASLSEETSRRIGLYSELLDGQRFPGESLEPELLALLTAAIIMIHATSTQFIAHTEGTDAALGARYRTAARHGRRFRQALSLIRERRYSSRANRSGRCPRNAPSRGAAPCEPCAGRTCSSPLSRAREAPLALSAEFPSAGAVSSETSRRCDRSLKSLDHVRYHSKHGGTPENEDWRGIPRNRGTTGCAA
jgi:hypothetical protein